MQANKTRRLQGRRGITPIRHKHRGPAKTRSQAKAGGRHVSVQQRTGTDNDGQRSRKDQTEHCDHQGQQGQQDGCLDGERKDAEVHQAAVTPGDQQDSTESVYSRSVQAVRKLSASTADTLASYETLPQEEERTSL